MNKILKNALIVLNLLIGLVVIYDFLALIFFPAQVITFVFNYFIYFLIASTLLTIAIYYYGSKEDKKVNSGKIIDSLLTSTPIFLVIFPVIVFVLLLVTGKILKSEGVSSLTGLIFPAYYISLILLPQLVLLGYITPEKLRTAVSNFFVKFKKIVTVIAVITDILGFAFLVSLVAFPTLAINATLSTFALPLFFLALVLSIIVVLIRLRGLKDINLIDYLPLTALIIVILGFVYPNLLGVTSVTVFAYIFYLVPIIIVILNLVPGRWNVKISKKREQNES